MSKELMETQVFTMEPRDLEEAMKFADLISKSKLVPTDYQSQPGNVLIAIQMGREIGLKPLQALQNIAVINGRPCVWGDALPAIAYSSKLVEDLREDFDAATMTATCQIKRKGQASAVVRTFSKQDAEAARLWGKQGTWQTHPKRMLQIRARAFAIRDTFPDYLKGLAVAEEQLDVVVESTETPLPAPPAAPKRLSEAKGVSEEKTQPDAILTQKTATPETAVSDWKQIPAVADGKCGICKEAIIKAQLVMFSPKKGLRCMNCDPTAGPKE